MQKFLREPLAAPAREAARDRCRARSPVFRRKYSDVDVVERTAQGGDGGALHELGRGEWIANPEEDPAIQAHFTFNKDIEGMSFEEVVSSTT